MLVIGGIVAVLALAAVAFAVAETGGDSPAQDDSSVQATDAAAATDAPVTSPEGDETDGDDGEQADSEQDDGADDAGTTTALNPAGHCVELPDTSDVIQHPDKHTNWTIADCEPSSDSGSPDEDEADDAPDADEPDDDGDGQEAEMVPATNPGGVCTEVSANSDVVRHPEKHPGWTLGECEEAGE
jgi:hypothetical protein